MRYVKTLKPVKSGLQFSDDGRFLRYVKQPVETDGGETSAKAAPSKGLIAKAADWLSPAQGPYGYASIHRSGLSGVSVSSIKWVPSKKPAKLPAFIAAAQPEIHPKTQPAWSPDSKTLYVHDKGGVWSAEISRAIGLPEWKLLVPRKNVRAFHISADGSRALLERDGKTRRVELVNIKEKRKPLLIGEGRCASFSPDGKRFAFLNGGGAFIADVQDGKPRRVGGSAGGQPNIQPNSRLQWSHDSRLLYVNDAEGVWSMEPDGADDRWALYVKAKGLNAYRVVSWKRRLKYVKKTPELPEFKTYIRLRAEADEMPAVSAADGKGGFVAASPALPTLQRSAQRQAEDNGGRKARYLISVDLSNKYPQMHCSHSAWESGSARAKDANRSWSYWVDSEGLHSMTTRGASAHFSSFRYDQ